MGGKSLITGIAVSGLGEGAYFMSMPHYRQEIKKKLGFDAFPGTFNIKISKKSFDSLKKLNSIKIDGYKSGDKLFGGASCYTAKIDDIIGAVIVPDINKHKGIMEFIAPVHLKSELKLKDGDKITIELK